MRILLVILIFLSSQIFAIAPKYSIKIESNVTDLLIENNRLYVATDIGTIVIYDTKSKLLIKKIELPFYLDFMGDTIYPKIFDIDFDTKQKAISIVSQTIGGFSDVFIYKDNKLKKIIDNKNRYMIKKAIFLNENNLILGLLSNEIIRFNIINRTVIYKTQISSYTFSDMCLSQKGGRIISSDESGRLNILSSKDGKVILIHEGENLDNVYKIDYKGNCIATAGQDRRLGVYLLHPFSSYHIQSDFLIYAVEVSPTGKHIAYLSDEDNDITIIDSKTKVEITTLKGHTAIVNSMYFLNENSMFSAADEPIVYYWEF